jgi:signal transduction histidine kinase
MKLQFKLALYNALTKLAIILFTGMLILFSLERITLHHIALRLREKKSELLNHLSSKEISQILSSEKSFIDYNILQEEYIDIEPLKNLYNSETEIAFSTEPRTIDKKTDTYRILKSGFNYNGRGYLLEIGETIDAVDELKSTIKGFTLLMLLIALSLTLLIDLIFTRYLLRPFYQIIDRKLVKVNDPMNFDYEKVTTTTQDFKMLDDSISSLMIKITNLFTLEKQFIANVSHELLTPISIISSRLENILQQEGLSEENENKIFASLKTLDRLKSIIKSLLLISQIENNQFHKNAQVNITDMVKDINEEFEDRLEDKKVKIINRVKNSFSIPANQSLMYTLLYNVINNAIKYNHEQGTITITDDLKEDAYTLEITDTGIGMDEREIEKAFNRFEKLDTGEKESYGLGLAIAKSITTFHNIDVQIISKKNIGTTFRLIFGVQA